MAFDRDRKLTSPAAGSGDNDGDVMRPHVPMIVRVWGDDGRAYTDVPVTPETTCRDLVDCCRDPGTEPCQLVAHLPKTDGELPLKAEERPLEILQRWNSDKDSLKLVLRYTVLEKPPSTPTSVRAETRHGMKEPGNFDESLPLEGVGQPLLSLPELREMAMRQQRQIDGQQQLLAAREQRLRYLKDQEARQQRAAAETERLRRLRDRVDQQELKLRKLRALRGQVECGRQNNVSLTSDLDSIRALFNEKEKELSLAVAKVDELTRQLEELRRGRPSRDQTPSAAAVELDKLRRELMYRNKLNEQQNARLCQQREALTARQEEMSNIDKRISELQDRLHRKRILNQQLANQITAASHKAHQPIMRTPNGAPMPPNHIVHNGIPNKPPSRGNIAAVEPYKHVPQQNQVHGEIIEPNKNDQNQEFLPEFAASKSDPKYQTLPYNTKFTVNYVKKDVENNNWPQENDNKNTNVNQHMTVHSIPLNIVNKSLATPLLPQNDVTKQKQVLNRIPNGDLKNKFMGNQIRGQPVGQPAPNLSTHPNLISQPKPISSVAPTSVSKLPTSIYQTSSTKIQPVQPQTLTNQQNLTLSPPQSTSTPIGTPEVQKEEKPSPKPALPPKPSIKPPPRQTTPGNLDEKDMQPNLEDPSPKELPLPPTPPIENVPAIKAKPLTIKKQSLGEQPRLRSLNNKMNGYHISINRRIEMPPAFLFPEMDSPPSDLVQSEPTQENDTESENASENSTKVNEETSDTRDSGDNVVMRVKKGNLKQNGKANLSRRVSFDPLALLLDASLEGELELVKKTATQVPNPSAANDEGITALHNAICAGHLDIVKFLVEFGCDVNAQDSDGWTPLHCAASCNNVAMVRFLVEHGACIFATTLSDHETAAEKCEEDEEGFDGCSEYLYIAVGRRRPAASFSPGAA